MGQLYAILHKRRASEEVGTNQRGTATMSNMENDECARTMTTTVVGRTLSESEANVSSMMPTEATKVHTNGALALEKSKGANDDEVDDEEAKGENVNNVPLSPTCTMTKKRTVSEALASASGEEDKKVERGEDEEGQKVKRVRFAEDETNDSDVIATKEEEGTKVIHNAVEEGEVSIVAEAETKNMVSLNGEDHMHQEHKEEKTPVDDDESKEEDNVETIMVGRSLSASAASECMGMNKDESTGITVGAA